MAPLLTYGPSATPVLLTLLFVALKLAGVIGWSWLWVLSPLWIAGALLTAIIVTSLAIIIARD